MCPDGIKKQYICLSLSIYWMYSLCIKTTNTIQSLFKSAVWLIPQQCLMHTANWNMWCLVACAVKLLQPLHHYSLYIPGAVLFDEVLPFDLSWNYHLLSSSWTLWALLSMLLHDLFWAGILTYLMQVFNISLSEKRHKCMEISA